MLSVSDDPEPCAEEEASEDAEEVEVGEPSSNAEPYRMGRKLLIGSGGPTMSAPGRAVKRAERRGFLEEVADDAEDEADVDDEDVEYVRRASAAEKA